MSTVSLEPAWNIWSEKNSANYPVQSLYLNLQKQKAVIYTSERKKLKKRDLTVRSV